MGCVNRPALTGRMEGHDNLTLTTIPSGAADGGPTTHGASFGADLMSFPFIYRGSKTDSNFFNVKSDVPEVLRVSEISHPVVSTRELCQTIDGNNIVASDCLTNTRASCTDYQKSDFCTNIMPVRGETATGYLMRAHGPDAKTSNISKSHISGYFSNSGCSTSMLSHVENAGMKGINNDVNAIPLQFGSAGKVDGSFLTLGIGGGVETRSNGEFSTREISSKLMEANSSQYNSYLGQQATRNSSSFTQLTGRAGRFQHQLSSSTFDLVNRTSTSEDGGLNTGANARLSSNPLPIVQSQQADILRNFSINIDRNSGFQYDLAPPSLPFRSTFIPHSAYAMSSPLGSEPAEPTYFASKPISEQQQKYYRKISMNVSPESSTNSHIDCHRGNSISHEQLRHLTPITKSYTTEVAKIGSFPTSVQSAGQLYVPRTVSSSDALGCSLFPESFGFPVSKGSTYQSAADSPFPKRLGVQPIDFAAARTAEGNLHQTQNCGPVGSFQKHVTPPFSIGPPQVGLASHVNPLGPIPSGQQHYGVPAQLSKDFPRVDHTNGQAIPVAKFSVQPQASPIPYHPFLKRRANENPLAARLGQRRKIIPQPVLNQSVPQQRQSMPAPIPAPGHMPATPLHVKWEGFVGPPKPSGQNCCLCKRDLSFTAEGPVSQPAVPPAVAVLPCGHTFHDHCLQVITPDDQSKYPPCIPCAIGET